MDSKNIKLDIDEALQQDNAYKEGVDVYQQLSEEAFAVAEEIASQLVQSIVKKTEDNKKENTFTISTAVLAVAKTLTMLVSYLYEDEAKYIDDIKKARELVVSRLIPAILNPTPCGLCVKCKNGHPEECLNPNMDTEYTETKFLPIISNMLLEYDIWTKIMYMYTEGRKIMPDKKEDNENGEL